MVRNLLILPRRGETERDTREFAWILADFGRSLKQKCETAKNGKAENFNPKRADWRPKAVPWRPKAVPKVRSLQRKFRLTLTKRLRSRSDTIFGGERSTDTGPLGLRTDGRTNGFENWKMPAGKRASSRYIHSERGSRKPHRAVILGSAEFSPAPYNQKSAPP